MKRLPMLLLAVSLIVSCARNADGPSDLSGRVSEFFAESDSRELATSAAKGDVKRVDRILARGAPIDTPGKMGVTAAWWAIRHRNVDGYAYLLSRGADPNPRVETITALEMASGYEDSRYLETALRYAPKLNLVSPQTQNGAVITAITYQRTKNLQLLIRAGADLNLESGTAGLPLLAATYLARYDYVLMMMDSGADPTKSIANGKITLASSIATRYIDPDTDAYVWRERVMERLRSKGIEVHRPAGERARTKPLTIETR